MAYVAVGCGVVQCENGRGRDGLVDEHVLWSDVVYVERGHGKKAVYTSNHFFHYDSLMRNVLTRGVKRKLSNNKGENGKETWVTGTIYPPFPPPFLNRGYGAVVKINPSHYTQKPHLEMILARLVRKGFGNGPAGT